MLLLIGEKETLYDPQTTLRLAIARVPGLSGAVVDNADHIAAMAQPRATHGERALRIVAPNPDATKTYASLYHHYVDLAESFAPKHFVTS